MKRKPSDAERLAAALEKLAYAINTLSGRISPPELEAYRQPYRTPTNPHGPYDPYATWNVPLGSNQC
jgi:hypothetical protein